MTENQIIAGDYLLKFMLKNSGMATADDYYDVLDKVKEIDQKMTIMLLKEIGIIVSTSEDDYILRLTKDGFSAAGDGLQQYLDQIKENEKLKRDSLKATIYSAWWNRFYAITAIVISIIAVLISIFNK